ncbi:ketoacyl-ACP synthase III family protein [Sphaerimonospora cavernae]|uniref:Ketoacyl-ACP synthase III family protein n=1 Tax=Sphaerimonospora cavernae TaxID=1740611 RepID=A0ABV6UCJ2_9ACTN
MLGDPVTAGRAVSEGSYRPEEAVRSRQRAAAVSTMNAPDLAVRAGRLALKRANRPAREIGLLIHANCFDQGVHFWNAAAYIQQGVLGHGDALAFEIRQMSNGGMCSVEVAAAQLTAMPELSAALLTTGDRFAEPRFPRWSADQGLVFGDAGTAMILCRDRGLLRLVATATHSEPRLEGLHRGEDLHAPPAPDEPIDLQARKKAFMAGMPLAEVIALNAAGMLTAVRRCLANAANTMEHMTAVVVPFFGADLVDKQCLGPLGLDPGKTLLEYGLDTGHLGAGDQFAGLSRLLETGRLARGERVLLVGVGAGFSWTCAVLEVSADG